MEIKGATSRAASILEPRDPDRVDAAGRLRPAGSNENPAVIAALVAAGADPKAKTTSGVTLLHRAAASNENLAVIAALLDAGAGPNAQDTIDLGGDR